ncbi:MAG: hypothetical protein EBU32_11730 [Opitutaceae bacterium]|nr:hypothetical protein [Opitutaceae bacterium]
MSTAIDEKQLRRAHELLCDWTIDFVVLDKKCFELDEEEHAMCIENGHHIPNRFKKDLGPDVARYVLGMQKLKDDVETLLQAPRDTSKRMMVVFDLNKLDELEKKARDDLKCFLHPDRDNYNQHTTNFWKGGRLYNILGILQHMRRAVGIPVTSDQKSVVRTSEMAHFTDHENEQNVGMRLLLTKLQAAV